MTAGKNRIRLSLEQLEDRCTPSATMANFSDDFPALHRELDGPTAEHVRDIDRHAVSITLSAHITSDGSGAVSITGVGSHLGHFTGQGLIHVVNIDLGADRVDLAGTATFTTKNGDKLFVSVTISFGISTHIGVEHITFTGGTGRFAGASGSATLNCQATGTDPTMHLAVVCDSQGSGTLVLDRQEHDAARS